MSEREMWFAAKSALALTFLLGACGEDSVGRDSCLGEGTRCNALTELRTPETLGRGSVSMREHATLEPVWERRLSVGVHQGAGNISALAGNARDGLWYLRQEIDGERMATYRLDEEGEVESGSIIEPPSGSALAASLSSNETVVDVRRLGQYPVNQAGPPIFGVVWGVNCGLSYRCEHNVDELVALPAEPNGDPWRLITGDYTWEAVRTDDGGAWFYAHDRAGADEDTFEALVGKGVLRKYDAQGRMTIDQSLVADFRPFANGQSVPRTRLVVTSRQELYLLTYPKGSIDGELWSFDARANLKWRVRYHDRKDATMIVDQRDRLVLVATDAIGDMVIERFDSRGDIEIAIQVTGGLRYQQVSPFRVTADAAGNIYTQLLISFSAPLSEFPSPPAAVRTAPSPQLCKFTLNAEIACYEVPHLFATMIVGGANNVVYSLGKVDVDANHFTDTLQRYELP